MSRYLMALSIGPVQDFIAAARRTRDLWMGSTILSEVAKAVAKWVTEQPPSEDERTRLERLIFPAPEHSGDLAAWEFSSVGDAPLTDFNVSNVIFAHVEADDPEAFASGARLRAEEKWNQFLNFIEQLDPDPETGKPGPFADVEREVWRRQRAHPYDVIEFYAAWVEYSDRNGTYAAARRRVTQILNGRKACRDFVPWVGDALRPKSSLDAARESVLARPYNKRRSDLRLRDREQLDIVGMVKRVEFGNDSIRYPSVSRFAVDPWLRGVRAVPEGRVLLEEIEAICDRLVRAGALTKRKEFHGKPKEDDTRKFSWLADFPFEGTPLYVDRHAEILEELPQRGDDEAAWAVRKEQAGEQLRAIAGKIGILKKSHDEPSPYFAILRADGDRIGATISKLAEMNDAAVHRAFSLAQTRFADEVRRRINNPVDWAASVADAQRFRGATVYAGADDALAFLPLDQALDCARMIHELFATTLRRELGHRAPRALAHLDAAQAFPTLSVGIAVGHFMEPIEDLLHYSREAEHRAKNPRPEEEQRGQIPRNGLAIAVHPRSGAAFTVRDNWDRGMHDRLVQWANLHLDKALPTKAAYDLRDIARQYDARWADSRVREQAIRADALRVLGRKRGTGDSWAAKEQVKGLLFGTEGRPGVSSADDLCALAHELIVGQWIADAQSQARGQRRVEGGSRDVAR